MHIVYIAVKHTQFQISNIIICLVIKYGNFINC